MAKTNKKDNRSTHMRLMHLSASGAPCGMICVREAIEQRLGIQDSVTTTVGLECAYRDWILIFPLQRNIR
jgi:hypothetical protein